MEVRPGCKQTEVGVIPEDWAVPFLRQHLLQDATYGVVKAGAFQRTGVPMLRGGDIKNGSIAEDQPLISAEKSQEYSRTVLKEQDVVIALVGYPGETAVIPKRLVGANISRAVGLLRPARNLRPEFLACYLNSPDGRKEFLRPSAGSAQIVVNLGALNQLQLPLPPLSEQRAIATALSDVDALLGGLDRLIAKKRTLKQAAMQQLLTGQTRLPGFSGAWEVKRLPALATIAQGQVDPRVAPYRSMYLIGPEHVEGGTGRLLTRRTALEQGAISGKYLFNAGDVVYGKINPYLRKAFLADFDGLCSADMYPLRPVDGVAPGFLLAVILGREFSTYSESVSARSGMPKINREEIAGFSTKVPKAFAEQAAISVILSDMDDEVAALELRRDKTRDLKHAMMQELLTGKTRLVLAGVVHA